ncbi:glucose 1-dehydrogenase [Salinicoccus albus]|uniref:glucose 1-dehydrogenase n=1 Tax=Salinicoccus albus TaxID=418756 RepID=UPI00035FFB9D|nr:glucose 1-dehydrogenase [Salinicoccus albus]
MKLDGKVAVITGAGSGMGRAIATLFAHEGANVVVSDMNLDTAEQTVKIITENDGQAISCKADITDQSDVETLIRQAVDAYGSLDILVNNAGMMDNMYSAGNISDSLWSKVMDVNVTGMMRTIRESLPIFLKKNYGVIVNMGSSSSLNGSRAGAAYTASKHAVLGLTKNIGFQYAESGVRCNAIAPGAVDTNIGTTMSEPDEFGMSRAMSGSSNNPRSGKPEEVAQIALFLASDDSNFVSGDIINADAGWMAY